jgi:hypothetical protein
MARAMPTQIEEEAGFTLPSDAALRAMRSGSVLFSHVNQYVLSSFCASVAEQAVADDADLQAASRTNRRRLGPLAGSARQSGGRNRLLNLSAALSGVRACQ